MSKVLNLTMVVMMMMMMITNLRAVLSKASNNLQEMFMSG